MPATTVTYAALGAGILLEVLATSLLHESRQFTRPLVAAASLLTYGAAFFFVSVALRALPMGVVYAVWSGVGIVLIAAIGRVAYGQRLDATTLLGLGLILSGVLVVNLVAAPTAR
jgi:small multidrug resistance pump